MVSRVHTEEKRRPCAPHIAHIIYRLDVGGLENGLVNLVNMTPANRYRHSIICLSHYTEFRNRIRNPDVRVYALHKRPGKDLPTYARLWKLLHKLRPDLVHTRNLGTLDAQGLAWLAGVRKRVHGEHGREADDPAGTNPKDVFLRKLHRPLVQRYVPMSSDLERWLIDTIGVRPSRIRQIYNGVDIVRFAPPGPHETRPLEVGEGDELVVGTVGRLDAVKDQISLVRALAIIKSEGGIGGQLPRLVILGEGPERPRIEEAARSEGLGDRLWLPGGRDDVAELMRWFDVFALPSLGEGISNTVLEAMACARPVVATRVGGNPELVVDGETGLLVSAAQPEALATALRTYLSHKELRLKHGAAGRSRVNELFSLSSMFDGYCGVYDELLGAGRTSAYAQSGDGRKTPDASDQAVQSRSQLR